MPAVNNELHVDLFRDALVTLGFNGITIDAAVYPDNSNAVTLFNNIMQAFETAQNVQNAAATVGGDVQLLTRTLGTGVQSREYPPASGTFIDVQTVTIVAGYAQQSAVTNTVPNLA